MNANPPSSRPSSSRRDAGMTLTELLVSVAMLGLLSVVLVGAIAVVFRSESGITNTVAESHDVQQAVNYFYLDVQSGPASVAAYRGTSGTSGDRGSGCSDAGNDNVFRFDTAGRRIAYLLTTSGAVGELDRYECGWNGSSWQVSNVLNIADRLDATGGAAIEVDVVDDDRDDEVDRVVMQFAQSVHARQVSASPRAEVGLPAATVGDCANDPLTATQNFQTFVEGDLHLVGVGVKQTLAVGGKLSFEGNVTVGQNLNEPSEFPDIPVLANTALLAGSIDWAASAAAGNGTISVHSGSDAAFGDFSGSALATKGQITTVFQFGDGNKKPSISVQNGGVVRQNISPIDFAAAFAHLRACADVLASMPVACSCAAHVGLSNINGDPYEGTASNDSIQLVLSRDTVNVLNIPEGNLADLHDLKWAGVSPSETAPLIVNVTSDADVTFEPPQIQGSGNTASYILWNFPNATGTVTIAGGGGDGVWGTVFAPYADVVSDVKIEGGVIAESLTFSGQSINPSRSFDGEIPWD